MFIYLFTFFWLRLIFPVVIAAVRVEESDAMNMPVIVMPKTIHSIANILASTDRGTLSPYLSDEITKIVIIY